MTAAWMQRLEEAAAAADWSAAAAALSALCEQAKKQAARQALQACDFACIHAALRSGEPKARKNAARLLSAVGTQADVPALTEALAREETRFVVPSMLLALGAIGGPLAKEALLAYAPPAPASPEQEKHCAEIQAAYKKALGRLAPQPAAAIRSLSEPIPLLLVPPAGFAEALLDELRAHGAHGEAVPGGVRVVERDIGALYRCRCLLEALIPCGETQPEPEAIAAAAKRGWQCFCPAGNEPALPYRIELRQYAGDRSDFIRRIARAVGGTDNPSGYAFELRVDCLPERTARVFVKPCAVNDQRFAYRKSALPASIHPVTAAAIVRTAKLRCGWDMGVQAHRRVFDPCCGSGTLLIEAGRLFGGAALMGTDIAANAVRIARENAAAAHCRATVLQKDCLRFVSRGPFDLVVTNLPFGNRVGTHESNEALYRGLAAKLPELLAPDGLAALYTMEGRLLERCLRAQRALTIIDSIRTDAGGLTPRVYFCRRIQGR